MAKKDLERLVGKAVLDPKFREKLFQNPERAIRDAGLKLSGKQIERLKKIDPTEAQAAITEMEAVARRHPWK
jgi:hypothetical protein